MNRESFIIIYTTLFLVLGIALFFVKIHTFEKNKDYRKSRISLGTGLSLIAVLGVSHLVFPQVHFDEFTSFGLMLTLCYFFTFLNYLSFLYMIETSHNRRIQILKIAVFVAPFMAALFFIGNYFPALEKIIEVSLSCIAVLIHFFLLTGCFREYDKFIIQRSNYFGCFPNISWIPTMLWATFMLACMTVGTFFFKPLILPTGVLSLIVYTYIPIKLLSITPEAIHQVRESVEKKDIDELPKTAADEKNAKRYEKIAVLVGKWIEEERYTQAELNIKDAATQMGTNSYYLSTYINRELDTTFAVWLNTLRIEKSKEYLTGNSSMSMEECGMKVGYNNLYNYSRWFKSITGVSPLKWKKNNT